MDDNIQKSNIMLINDNIKKVKTAARIITYTI